MQKTIYSRNETENSWSGMQNLAQNKYLYTITTLANVIKETVSKCFIILRCLVERT